MRTEEAAQRFWIASRTWKGLSIHPTIKDVGSLLGELGELADHRSPLGVVTVQADDLAMLVVHGKARRKKGPKAKIIPLQHNKPRIAGPKIKVA